MEIRASDFIGLLALPGKEFLFSAFDRGKKVLALGRNNMLFA
jgi:hypothetical protein